MSLSDLHDRLLNPTEVPLNQDGLGDDGSILFPLLSTLSDGDVVLVVSQGPTWEDATKTAFTLKGHAKEPRYPPTRQRPRSFAVTTMLATWPTLLVLRT